MSAVVSDTTSLIALAGQGRLGVLGACFEEVLLPDAVYAEWLAGDPTVIQRVQDHAFLTVATVTDTALLKELELLLDRGEAEALTLAKTRGLPLLVDEKKSRAVARMMGVPVQGLVGLLILAVERQHLAVIPECRRARDTFWDVQVAKMTALGDSLCARIRPAGAPVPDSPLVRRARQHPQMA